MKSILRIIIFALSGFFAVSAFGQTTYTQTPRECLLDECNKATFTPPALLSYFIPKFNPPTFQGNIETQTFPASGNIAIAQWCVGSLTCMQANYNDFNGKLVRTIHSSDPNCPESTQCYELTGTFNSGHNIVDEKWQCFRSCGNASNISGSVTVQ